MIIELTSLGRRPKPIKFELQSVDIDLDESTRLTTNTDFIGEISRRDTKTRISGHINGMAESDCVRCLEPVAKKLDFDFEAVFVGAAGEPNADEIELRENELAESFIDDNEIDLIEVIREQILLAMAMRVVCKENCQGLCPQCGKNLNLIDCRCEENEIDPRWAVLKNLN